MSRFLNSRYGGLEAYTPGEQPQDKQYIKLNTNESPYPPSPKVQSVLNGADFADLRLYSDPECDALKRKLAEFYGFSRENVFVSNGSDDILNFAFMAFGEKGAVYPDISYGFYPVFADLNHTQSEIIPLKDDFTIDIEDYFNKNKLIVIANPNAPTGIALPASAIEEIVKNNPNGVVVIDEAYVDFGGESCVQLVKKYDNLLVVMTYSKSRSMAGARLGFALGSSQLIADIELLKYSTNPYNVNRLTLKLGEAALDDREYYEEKCRAIAATRERSAAQLKMLGFTVLPSSSNFLFIKSDTKSGEYIYKELKARGVLIRHFTKERIKDFNRITVGTDRQMDTLINMLKDIL